jgi:hypothetical protein
MDLNLVDFLVSEDGIFPKDQINGYMDGLPKGSLPTEPQRSRQVGSL